MTKDSLVYQKDSLLTLQWAEFKNGSDTCYQLHITDAIKIVLRKYGNGQYYCYCHYYTYAKSIKVPGRKPRTAKKNCIPIMEKFLKQTAQNVTQAYAVLSIAGSIK